MAFSCPECEHIPFDTIKAWKRHMTQAHQGHTQDQLNDALGGNGAEGAAITGSPNLAAAIESMPVTEGEDSNVYVIDETPEERKQRKEAEKDAKAARKRIQAKLDNFKDRMTGDVPVQIFRHAGINIDDKDQAWLKESIELGLEVVGVQIEVTPYNIPIRNPLWILLYPLMVMAFIIGKAILTGAKGAEQDNWGNSTEGQR